jgi:hypothetical protein
MLEITMNSPAIARPSGRSRLALIVAGFLALLGSFVVTAPAQAGYYGNSYYGPNGNSYYGSNRCSYRPRCGYAPYRHYGCSSCGCRRPCNSGLVYERRYVEREYVERRYGCCRPHYGYYPDRGYRRQYGYNPFGGYQFAPSNFPWGYGGVRGWRAPYGDGYQPSAYGYEDPPRPPAPVWDGAGDEAVPDGYERAY